MIRPAVVSLCAESAPYVLDLMRQPDVEQVGMYNVVTSYSTYNVVIVQFNNSLWSYKIKVLGTYNVM